MPERKPSVREPLQGFDRLLEHRVRLAVAVLLTRHERLSFSRLKELTEETDGSLGAQLRRLEEASYVEVEKEFVGRRPVTWYALAPEGRRALASHLAALQGFIGQADLG